MLVLWCPGIREGTRTRFRTLLCISLLWSPDCHVPLQRVVISSSFRDMSVNLSWGSCFTLHVLRILFPLGRNRILGPTKLNKKWECDETNENFFFSSIRSWHWFPENSWFFKTTLVENFVIYFRAKNWITLFLFTNVFSRSKVDTINPQSIRFSRSNFLLVATLSLRTFFFILSSFHDLTHQWISRCQFGFDIIELFQLNTKMVSCLF